MFGSPDDLGFSTDDLDQSAEARVLRGEHYRVSQGARLFNVVLALLVPALLGLVFVLTLRSDLPNRWTTFWAMTSIVLAIALAMEVFIVNKQLRLARDTHSLFTGDERA